MLMVVIGVAALVIGFIIGKVVTGNQAKKIEEAARKEADQLLVQAKKDAESVKKDKLLEAKEYYIQRKGKFEQEANEKNKKLQKRENQLNSQQGQLSKKLEETSRKNKELEELRENLNQQLELISHKKDQIEKQLVSYTEKLEQLSGYSREDAKKELIESMKREAETDAMSQIKEIVDEAKIKANKEAKKIIIQTIQRTAAENTIENTVSVFNLDSDDQKGQIIGREGRNIRAIEAATGCEIIVDDTPEAIIISGYDPVRREIARLSLQRLVTDGRIHPARIEEVVRKTSKQLEDHIREIGERTVIDLGIQGMHKELIRYVGRMRFRSSYGQNLLQHSREVANMCATMASELGLNAKLAKRAGLLHNIGKVPEDEPELSHALLGKKLCEKYGEHKAVCNAVGAHHDEIEMKFAISPIIQTCDAVSGARPGARREIMESYLKRIKELETIALDQDGVQKAYAIQAGRELRVIVESDKVKDEKAEEISFAISKKIQDEMTYPGQIKVTVIREKRAVSIAK